jgi:hypothetical protein
VVKEVGRITLTDPQILAFVGDPHLRPFLMAQAILARPPGSPTPRHLPTAPAVPLVGVHVGGVNRRIFSGR